MRQKRAKAYKKLMHLYCLTFSFRQPYQVLVDAEICRTAIANNIELAKQLANVLQGEVKPMITQCCIHELYLQGKSMQPAVDLAKSFERRKCNHREVIPGQECIASVIGDSNKHRYAVASQLQPLRAILRHIPGVPLVHINRSVVILEPPSDATLKVKEANEEKSLHAKPSETQKDAPTASSSEPPKKKRKGPKGPNPLSVKKKQPKPAQPVPTSKPATPPAKPKPAPTVGDKRKADSDDDNQSDAEEARNSEESSKKKRKRKRRKTQVQSETLQPVATS